jgi:hypothetical protein
MTVKDFNSHVGAIVVNLQGIETAIRFFFFRKNGETNPFPKPGVTETPSFPHSLTAYRELSKWIRRFNSGLTKEELPRSQILNGVVEIRDAIAHGRLVGPEPPQLPYTLWKFGQPVNGDSPVRFSVVLTEEWLSETTAMIDRQLQQVVDCHRARGYPGYP